MNRDYYLDERRPVPSEEGEGQECECPIPHQGGCFSGPLRVVRRLRSGSLLVLTERGDMRAVTLSEQDRLRRLG